MKCRCGKDAIYFRRWEGRHYCKKCFIEQIEKQFKRTVRKNSLISREDKIAIALSGGKDSSTLLYLLKKFFRNDLIAITIDEGIEYKSKAIASAKRFAKDLGVKHYIFSFKNEFGFQMNEVQNVYCGVLRRYLLNKKAFELKATKLAVGHHLDNEAQSIIMNFLKGDFSRFQRLGAYPILISDKKFVPRIKPLRDIHENEISLYASLRGIPFHSGHCCTLSEGAMRWDVAEILNDLEEKRPGTKLQIVNFYDKIRPFTVRDVKEKINYCKCGEPTSREVCRVCEILGELGIKF